MNLLRADDIRLVGTACCESVDLINLVNNWEQAVRTHLVDKPSVRLYVTQYNTIQHSKTIPYQINRILPKVSS